MSHLELKSVHLFSFLEVEACASVCVCVWLHVMVGVCNEERGREGGSNDTPGTFGCSVIFKVTHLRVMSRYQSRNSFL